MNITYLAPHLVQLGGLHTRRLAHENLLVMLCRTPMRHCFACFEGYTGHWTTIGIILQTHQVMESAHSWDPENKGNILRRESKVYKSNIYLMEFYSIVFCGDHVVKSSKNKFEPLICCRNWDFRPKHDVPNQRHMTLQFSRKLESNVFVFTLMADWNSYSANCSITISRYHRCYWRRYWLCLGWLVYCASFWLTSE